MRRITWIVIAAVVTLSSLSAPTFGSGPNDDQTLLKTREAVWRAWFADDTNALKELVPADTIVISAGEEKWKNQAEIFQAAAQFKRDGGKLIRLEFPRTEIQRYGNFAVTYSKYLYEIDMNGKRSVTSGRVTEVFVRRNGKWTNPGWHTDTEK